MEASYPVHPLIDPSFMMVPVRAVGNFQGTSWRDDRTGLTFDFRPDRDEPDVWHFSAKHEAKMPRGYLALFHLEKLPGSNRELTAYGVNKKLIVWQSSKSIRREFRHHCWNIRYILWFMKRASPAQWLISRRSLRIAIGIAEQEEALISDLGGQKATFDLIFRALRASHFRERWGNIAEEIRVEFV